MKKILLLVLFFFFPILVSAQSDEGYEYRKARLQPKVELYAEKYSVPAWVMNHIIDAESSYNTTAVGDMKKLCWVISKQTGLPVKHYGKPIRAKGLAQITDCYFGEISDEQAFDEDFALDFLASGLSKGYCTWMWSTCPYNKKLTKN